MHYEIIITRKGGKILFEDRIHTKDRFKVCGVAAHAAVSVGGRKPEDYFWRGLQSDLYENKTKEGYKFEDLKIHINYRWWD